MKMNNGQPKHTFWNLPEEKRSRIIQTAMEEFAASGYEKASLNMIVRQLGIAKGSLYQYFANKEALFLFLFDRLKDLAKKTLSESVPDRGTAGFFVTIRAALLTGVRFIDRHPLYFNLYLKVLFERGVPYREELIAKVRLFSRDYFGPHCLHGISTGELRSDIPVETMSFVLDAVFDRFLQGYVQPYLDGGLALGKRGREELEQQIDLVLAVLRSGLAAPEFRTRVF